MHIDFSAAFDTQLSDHSQCALICGYWRFCVVVYIGVETKKNIQMVVGRLGWKCTERSVQQLLLLQQKEVELLFIIYIDTVSIKPITTRYGGWL